MDELTDFSDFTKKTRPALRKEIEGVVSAAGRNGTPELLEMITYQLGWTGEGAGPRAEGKGLRAMFTLLACQAAGGEWKTALPAAAAVELLHNFSLIHDDIQDRGEIRRGRPAVWKIWGEAQAINAGDAMFALANSALLGLADTASIPAALQAGRLFNAACLRLTQGQHLDISFEEQEQIELETYWQMVGGKTAALLAFSLEVGALAADTDPDTRSCYHDFGRYLGLSFQVQDDILGIWGEEEQTGKSTIGDLIARKKTLPVLFGLAQQRDFYAGWSEQEISPDNALRLSEILQAEGGRAYAQNTAERLMDLALQALQKARPQAQSGRILESLAQDLLRRAS